MTGLGVAWIGIAMVGSGMRLGSSRVVEPDDGEEGMGAIRQEVGARPCRRLNSIVAAPCFTIEASAAQVRLSVLRSNQ